MAKKKKAKAKGPHSGYWRTKADKVWSQSIRTLYSGLCAVCGAPGGVAHHLIGRNVPFTRHALMNGIALCVRHHVYDPRFSAHGCSVAFSEWLKVADPARWNYVMRNKNKLKMPYDYKAAYEKLQDFLKLSKWEMDKRLEEAKELDWEIEQ